MNHFTELEKETIGLRGILRKDTETDFKNLFLFFLSKQDDGAKYIELVKELNANPHNTHESFQDFLISNVYSLFLGFKSLFSSFHLPPTINIPFSDFSAVEYTRSPASLGL